MDFDQNDADYCQAMELYLSGERDKAQPLIERAIKRFPNSTFLLSLLGDVYYAQGRLELSIDTYRKAVAVNPSYAMGYYKIGVSAYRAGRLTQALAGFMQAVAVGERSQTHVMAYYFIGLINYFHGDEKTALDYFTRLKEASPESLIANYYMAQLRLRAREFDEAIALLSELAEHAPAFADVQYLLGEAFFGKHDNREAIEHLRQALLLRPDDQRARSLLMLLTDTPNP